MRTPFGRIGRFTVGLALLAACVIVTGLIVPGRTGTIIEAVGWGVVAIAIFLKIGIQTTTPRPKGGGDPYSWK
jgi:hypothetical protein